MNGEWEGLRSDARRGPSPTLSSSIRSASEWRQADFRRYGSLCRGRSCVRGHVRCDGRGRYSRRGIGRSLISQLVVVRGDSALLLRPHCDRPHITIGLRLTAVLRPDNIGKRWRFTGRQFLAATPPVSGGGLYRYGLRRSSRSYVRTRSPIPFIIPWIIIPAAQPGCNAFHPAPPSATKEGAGFHRRCRGLMTLAVC